MKKRSMPKEHPVAWASQLWPHLELIRSMRRQRKKWAEITDHLEREHSVKVTFRTVRNFFKRATDPKRKRPLGFPQHSTPPTPDQLTETEIHAKKETNENPHTYEKWEEAERQRNKEIETKPLKPYQDD